MNKLIFAATILVLALATNFDITSSSTCTNFTAGFCTKWEQTGTVQEQMGSCFPASARVMGRNGPISMQELKRGDEILGLVDGKEDFVKVTSWLHRDTTHDDEFLQLNTEAGWLQVSPKHNLASFEREYKFASEVTSLYPVGNVDSHGKYAPKTTSNNFFVLL